MLGHRRSWPRGLGGCGRRGAARDAGPGRARRASSRRRSRPLGTVHLGGETWTARTPDEQLCPRDTPVRLVGFDGLTAIVEAVDPPIPPVPPVHPIPRPLRGRRGRGPALTQGEPMELVVALAVLAFLLAILLVILYLSVRVVQQYERMVVFRLGKTNEAMIREPGLRFLVPVVDRPVKVDLRETLTEVPSQTTITKDNAPINVDFLVYWRIADPLKSVLAPQRLDAMLLGVASTTLRAVIGDISLDEVLSKREQINEVLRIKLDEVTERWGGKVTTVEIREITPPRDVQDAMNRQLSAERTRRAVITESEGNRQAAINVAEGQKQSEILKAEGERQAAILRAEGFSQALERIYARRTRSTRRRWRSSTSRPSSSWAPARRPSSSSRPSSRRLAEQIGGYVDRGMDRAPDGRDADAA